MQTAPARLAMALLPGLFLVFTFFIPLLYILAYALGAEDSRGMVAIFQEILGSPYHRQRIGFTYVQALLSTALTLLLAIPAALLLALRRVPMRSMIQSLLIVPFVLPALVVALAFEAFLGANGTVAHWSGRNVLAWLGPLGSILLAHAFYNVGLVTRLLTGYWSRVPTELVAAARSLGANRTRTLLLVLLPLGAPAILSAATLVFLFCASSFALILVLGRPNGTIETLIAEEATAFLPEYDLAAGLGILQLLTTLGALGLYVALERRSRAWFRPRPEDSRPPMAWWGFVPLALPLLLVLGPLLSLIHQSILTDRGYGLDAFRLLASNAYPIGSYGVPAIVWNSLRFAILTVLIAVPLAFLLAIGFRHVRARYAVLESFFLAPLGASAVLVGLGFLLAYDGSPFPDLRASPVRIILAHTLIAFPFASRILAPSLDSLDPNINAAARTLGATRRQTLRHVELPLMRSALAAAALFSFAVSLGEFGATFMLRRPEYTTVPLAVFDAYGRVGTVYHQQAQALSVVLLAFAFIAFFALERLQGQRRPAP